jgi:hypothetical protein
MPQPLELGLLVRLLGYHGMMIPFLGMDDIVGE